MCLHLHPGSNLSGFLYGIIWRTFWFTGFFILFCPARLSFFFLSWLESHLHCQSAFQDQFVLVFSSTGRTRPKDSVWSLGRGWGGWRCCRTEMLRRCRRERNPAADSIWSGRKGLPVRCFWEDAAASCTPRQLSTKRWAQFLLLLSHLLVFQLLLLFQPPLLPSKLLPVSQPSPLLQLLL
jgi:hypothetical protein